MKLFNSYYELKPNHVFRDDVYYSIFKVTKFLCFSLREQLFVGQANDKETCLTLIEELKEDRKVY